VGKEEEEEEEENSSSDGYAGSESGSSQSDIDNDPGSDDDDEDDDDQGTIAHKLLVLPNDFEAPPSFSKGSTFTINPLATVINCNEECHVDFKGYFASKPSDKGWKLFSKTNPGRFTAAELDAFCGGKISSFYMYENDDGTLFPMQYQIYSVHCSYGGTEDLESLCQRRVALPVSYGKAILDDYLMPNSHIIGLKFKTSQLLDTLQGGVRDVSSPGHAEVLNQVLYFLCEIGLLVKL
jgi:hypothetical protein